MTAPSYTPITEAVLANLRTQINRVYDSSVPANSPAPYAMLVPAFSLLTAQMADRERWARLTYQVTCVGLDRVTVEDIEARARQAMSQPLTPTGWSVWQVRTNESPGLMVDYDVTPHLLYSTPTWQVFANPV